MGGLDSSSVRYLSRGVMADSEIGDNTPSEPLSREDVQRLVVDSVTAAIRATREDDSGRNGVAPVTQPPGTSSSSASTQPVTGEWLGGGGGGITWRAEPGVWGEPRWPTLCSRYS